MNTSVNRKFPRTPHLSNSESLSSDDKKASKETLEYLASGIELCVSEKLDGSNYNFSKDRAYARSLDGTSHAWDTPAKAIWANIRHDLPEGFRFSGESLYGRRSVAYENLPSPFMLFGVWNAENVLLSWDEMAEWAELFDLSMVPLLYRGTDFKAANEAWGKILNSDISEGYVIRDAGQIPYDEYGTHVAKYVRKNHVRTSDDFRRRNDFALNTFRS